MPRSLTSRFFMTLSIITVSKLFIRRQGTTHLSSFASFAKIGPVSPSPTRLRLEELNT